ncbi:MAG TPA: PDDEXK nuclease domain-containing protein [Gammaproteobacteria bacterium]|nr:PDDEXK nuclease domain-containing protein [Gammaproteobacteria bacterium]
MVKDISATLFQDICQLINAAKSQVAYYVNSSLVMLYWKIGSRINESVLRDQRGEYGERIVRKLAKQLTIQYGSGFEPSNLFRTIQFVRVFPEQQIVATLSQQLSWSHLRELIVIDDPLKRDFYAEMCRLENWSVRGLRQKISGMLYERTAIAKQPESVIRTELDKLKQGDRMNPDLYLQDPCLFKFLYPHQILTEKDLEEAILNELQVFIQEMGSDFCFVARQKRMSTMQNDRFLDLLFFHRGMRRLVAIELKMSAFQPEHAGQMEWYLKWLDKHERNEGEEKPLGIIICAKKDQEDVELLELGKNGIHVAQFLTESLPREVFEKKLQMAIQFAREKYEQLRLTH